jgi:hypothetical protein
MSATTRTFASKRCAAAHFSTWLDPDDVAYTGGIGITRAAE